MTTDDSTHPARRAARTRFRRRMRRRAVALGIGAARRRRRSTRCSPRSPQVATRRRATPRWSRRARSSTTTPASRCHGANLQGVQDRGPSLIGVGEAAVYFQVSTGRMPLARQEAQAQRKPPLPQFDPETEEGAGQPRRARRVHPGQRRRPDAPDARRPRCAAPTRPAAASCSGSTARPATTSPAAAARCPRASSRRAWTRPPRRQIYTAMLTGPQNMPKFSDRQLTPEEKQDIIAYVKSVSGDNNNPGGNALGGIGPVSEGVDRLHRRPRRADRISHCGWERRHDHLAASGSDRDGAGTRETHDGPRTPTRRRARGHDAGRAGPARPPSSTTSRSSTTSASGRCPGTRAEKRAERAVALWFIISALSGLAFIVAFLFWPCEYVAPGEEGVRALRALHAAHRAHLRALPCSRSASA